jgi:polysaccharide pyruvyl transferase WcaK-like protein
VAGQAFFAQGYCPGTYECMEDSHYQSIYFHEFGANAKQAYERYVAALARAIDVFRKERGVFPILFGMERFDAGPCQQISARLGGVPVFTSEQYNAFHLVSILRSCDLIVSSRYNAIVTSMPRLVPSAGSLLTNAFETCCPNAGTLISS